MNYEFVSKRQKAQTLECNDAQKSFKDNILIF